MKVLVVGSGGREDAFLWKFNQEVEVEELFVSPGHGGMERFSKVSVLGNLSNDEIVEFARDQKIDLVVVGPEAPLTHGLADQLKEAGIVVFGPGKLAARLEGSKIFSKEFMGRHQIPTAEFAVFDSYKDAVEGLKSWPIEKEGIVIKADGLAGGKGVVVTHERDTAEHTVYDFMVNKEISVKTDKILFESVLPGDEVSVFAMANGLNFVVLGSACDHKRVGDNDTGPNTGGMGCFHDPQWPDQELKEKIVERILKPTLKGCLSEGMSYNGFLFMGLMVNQENDPYVVEYNVRFGDPETQTLLPLVKGSLAKALFDLVTGLGEVEISLEEKYSVHVVATSGGYPSLSGDPLDLGHVIKFQEGKELVHEVFYAGVQKDPRDRGLLNSGGRVLGVTALGSSVEEARRGAYEDLEKISFKGMHFRKDIGAKKRGHCS